MPKLPFRRSFLLLSAMLVFAVPTFAARAWPTIQAETRTYDFPDARKASVTLPILGEDEKPLYRIECHQFGFADPAFDYSGDFECRLRSLYSKETYSTLFTDDPNQSRDWESRARFLSEELAGSCADYPEYGRVRSFSLRGMKIELALSRVVLDPSAQPRPSLKSFDLKISVESSADAKTPIAAPVAYQEPPYMHPGNNSDHSRNCSTVLKK
jgi:hypothetical protein